MSNLSNYSQLASPVCIRQQGCQLIYSVADICGLRAAPLAVVPSTGSNRDIGLTQMAVAVAKEGHSDRITIYVHTSRMMHAGVVTIRSERIVVIYNERVI
jgi:hypothetical protein